MRNHQYDVTIVGAGPSGAILAYLLAKQGVKVHILEKSPLPRKKTCAGGITVRAKSLLPFEFDEIVEDTIRGVRLSYHRIPKRVRTYDQPLAYMVIRDKFDYLLDMQAREAGATLVDKVHVRQIQVGNNEVLVKTDHSDFVTTVLVGADGANSTVVQSLGLRTGFEYGLGINVFISPDKEKQTPWEGLIGLDYGIPGGYAWVFPKRSCLSIGAGGSFRVARTLKPYTLKLINAYGLGNCRKSRFSGAFNAAEKKWDASSTGKGIIGRRCRWINRPAYRRRYFLWSQKLLSGSFCNKKIPPG
jgi:flavin-dependent dehydrogenase